MSYKNLKLTLWTHPKTGEERLYINTRFCDRNARMSDADGCWIRADENGMPRFGFKPSYNGEGRAFALCEVAALLTNLPASQINVFSACPWGFTFNDLKGRVAACQTKGGNFSYTQYEKAFDKVAA